MDSSIRDWNDVEETSEEDIAKYLEELNTKVKHSMLWGNSKPPMIRKPPTDDELKQMVIVSMRIRYW